MASKTKATESVVTVNEPSKSAESVYTREELANNHKAFNTYREIVDVALLIAGKETATFAEAKTIIEKFNACSFNWGGTGFIKCFDIIARGSYFQRRYRNSVKNR